MAATNSLEILVHDWPTTFLVSTEEYDRDYYFFFPEAPKELTPHFVDIEDIFCSCRDFRYNLKSGSECKHIIAARKFRDNLKQQPKKMQEKLWK